MSSSRLIIWLLFATVGLGLSTKAHAQSDPTAISFTAIRELKPGPVQSADLKSSITLVENQMASATERITLGNGTTEIGSEHGKVDAVLEAAPTTCTSVSYHSASPSGTIREVSIAMDPSYGQIRVTAPSRETADATADKIAQWLNSKNGRTPAETPTSVVPPTPFSEYKESHKYSALRMSRRDLGDLITSIRDYCASANRRPTTDEKLLVIRNDVSAHFEKGFDINDLGVSPERALEIHYRVEFAEGPIHSVEMNFSDFTREVNVNANDGAKATALLAIADATLLPKSTIFGGPIFRMCFWLLLWTVLPLTVWIVWQSKNAAWVAYMAGMVMFWTMPTETWLAGTALFSNSASFAERHNADLSLWGVGLGVLFFILGPLYNRMCEKKTQVQNKSIVQGPETGA